MRRIAKVDKNQPVIVKQLRAFGCAVLHTHQLKNAFDILVGYNGALYMIEIKADKKGKLTKGENECKTMFERVGVPYYTIHSFEQFLEILNEENKN